MRVVLFLLTLLAVIIAAATLMLGVHLGFVSGGYITCAVAVITAVYGITEVTGFRTNHLLPPALAVILICVGVAVTIIRLNGDLRFRKRSADTRIIPELRLLETPAPSP